MPRERHYFTGHNTEHYHSGIEYVTPDQAHRGLMSEILEHKQLQKLSQRRLRWEADCHLIPAACLCARNTPAQ